MTRRRSSRVPAARIVESRSGATEPPEPPTSSADPGLGSWPWIAALVVLVFAAFAPALSGEFLQWDDDDNIGLNHEFRGLDAPHLEWMFTTNRMGPYQPLAWVSLGVDHALYGLSGPEVYPEAPEYHRTSVAIHALAAIAFFFLAKRLLRAPLAAFAAAAFFAIHPLRVESVAWVTERRDVLCGLFYVLAGWAWLRHAEREPDVDASGRRLARTALASLAGGALAWLAIDLSDPKVLALATGGAWMLAASAVLLGIAAWSRGSRGAILALLFFLAALLSKGLAIVLPLVLFVADVWPLRRARDLRTSLACAVEKLPMLALSVLFARIAFWGQQWIPGLMASWEEHTLWKRTLQAFYGLAFYVGKTVVPTRLSPLYDLPPDIRVLDPRFLVPVVAVLAVAVFLLVKRRRFPALAAACAAYALAVAPVLGFSQAGPQLVADRYSYLACLPFALLAGAAIARFERKPMAIAAAAAVLLGFGGLTYAYTGAWKSSTSLWERAHAIDPSSMLANVNLGHARLRHAQGPVDRAARTTLLADANRCFDAARATAEHPLVYAGLAKLKQIEWQLDPQHPKETAEASLEFARRALELAKARSIDNPTYHLDYAVALGNADHPNEAMDELRDYLKKEPDSFAGRCAIGLLYMRVNHDDAAAERELERAVAIEPGAVDAWGNLGIAKQDLGKRDEAIRCYERVLALHPGHPIAQDRLFKLKSRMTVDVVPQDAPKKK
jgi:tetratricopeptide (TPR) repeat protein